MWGEGLKKLKMCLRNIWMVHIRYNAKPSLKSKQGWTALDFAQKQNQQDAVLYLQDIMKRQKILTNPGKIQLIQNIFCS